MGLPWPPSSQGPPTLTTLVLALEFRTDLQYGERGASTSLLKVEGIGLAKVRAGPWRTPLGLDPLVRTADCLRRWSHRLSSRRRRRWSPQAAGLSSANKRAGPKE